ncbi:MAG: cobalt chelatase [Actinomycetota bacterium]
MRSNRLGARLGSAGLRAVAGQPDVELRGARTLVGGEPLVVVVPYLAARPDTDADTDPDPRRPDRRGVVDGLGLRVRHSDPDLHARLAPTPLLERIVFDIAEQFRCEALADPALPGVRSNTAAAFDRWSDSAQASRIGETGVGLLVFTITHMLRARLLRRPAGESVDELIEGTRANLARLTGHALQALPALIDDQVAFAEPAGEIARLVAELVADADESADEVPESIKANALLASLDWELLVSLAETPVDGAAPPPPDADYQVFTTAHDREMMADTMYRAPVLRRLRADLEQHRAEQAVSVSRLTQRLRTLFATWREDGWSTAEEDGALDPTRLAQIVADPTNPLVNRRPRPQPTGDAAVTFLIDTSGSMKRQRYESVAVLVDTLVRALEPAGAVTEVLGFSTGAWAGGRAVEDWRAAGAPAAPGRLAELAHIVYKEFDQTWRQARFGLAAMLRTDHYREGVDGEALLWANRRLVSRPERRRILVVISDGHPMEAATTNHNRDGFLADHLRAVAARIEADGAVALGAIGIEQELDEYIAASVALDLTETLTIGAYDVLHQLFGPRR